ncbi:MAG: deoxyribonuclease IV [Mycoplasmoidaceae bacterium]|nr:MAG: deoxyribonuclease IV [Mycoplasmoidaceae bacterium]
MDTNSNKLLIGSFVSSASPKYLLESIDIAMACGENCFMIYTGSPQSFLRTDIQKMNVKEFKEKCKLNNITLSNVIVHVPYIINLASNEKDKQEFAYNFLLNEIKRVSEIGCKYLVVHPGNATNNITIDEAIENCARIINKLISNKENDVVICLETMSGKGTEIGKSFQEINQIISLIKSKNFIGVCLDTCHTWDAGYNWSDTNKIMNEFDKVIGLEYIKCIHLNDSLNECGSKKDRHANIGYGKIGFDNLINICYHNDLISLPKILETPVVTNEITTYKNEIEMIKDKKFINWMK